ncbi:hypothetical protein P9112_012065 [Eukaryota sp. TZLM1-RC]
MFQKTPASIPLSKVPTWEQHGLHPVTVKTPFTYSSNINSKVSLYRGDSTKLKIDSIVNAANSSLLGGGGIDGVIHRAAGPKLLQYCRQLNGCPTGKTKKSPGFKLPCKFILHTVGPIGENEAALKSCYKTCMDFVDGKDIRSIAFCAISTGIYGYPKDRACRVALNYIREWLEVPENMEKVDRIVFVVFDAPTVDTYTSFFPVYFPKENTIIKKDEFDLSDSSCYEEKVDSGAMSVDSDEDKPQGKNSVQSKEENVVDEQQPMITDDQVGDEDEVETRKEETAEVEEKDEVETGKEETAEVEEKDEVEKVIEEKDEVEKVIEEKVEAKDEVETGEEEIERQAYLKQDGIVEGERSIESDSSDLLNYNSE